MISRGVEISIAGGEGEMVLVWRRDGSWSYLLVVFFFFVIKSYYV